jgi:formylglycine-generating enzyme required for sulfatase activity
VAKKKANAFGLHDMHGNAFEWVEDPWHLNYNGAPTDGSAWLEGGNDSLHVVRGGSWGSDPQDLRSAVRGGNDAVIRVNSFGFRLARTLNP